jgi:hypothetical protein
MPFVASLQFDGSDVKKAMAWTNKSLGLKYNETSIGDVRFKLKQDTAKSIYLFIEAI